MIFFPPYCVLGISIIYASSLPPSSPPSLQATFLPPLPPSLPPKASWSEEHFLSLYCSSLRRQVAGEERKLSGRKPADGFLYIYI